MAGMQDIRWWHPGPLRSVTAMTAVAVLGTGNMGAAMVRRLLATGHQVTVWNRTAARTAPLVADGARAAGSPAEAVADVDVVITMLSDAAAVDAALTGPAGAAAALPPGTPLVQMSTISPDSVRDLARRLPGVALVDAPVGGSVAATEAGRLTVLAAGEDSALDAATPVLSVLGTVRRCGAVGGGSAVKLVLNTALITAMAALGDTLAVADAVGVDRAGALELLASGALGGAVGRATASGAVFSLTLAGKDVGLARQQLGDRPAPVLRATAEALRTAPDQAADLATLAIRSDP